MTFGDLKLLRSCVFICLPTLVVVGLLVYFFIFDVPEIARESQRRFLVELE